MTAEHNADTVRLVRTVHVRDRLGDLASTEPFKLGIDATIVSVEWDREVALVTWLVQHNDGPQCISREMFEQAEQEARDRTWGDASDLPRAELNDGQEVTP